jgi:hypothetical protein
MIQPKVKPVTRTVTICLPEDEIAALDEYCRFLGGATDRTYVIAEALRQVIRRDRRFKNRQGAHALPGARKAAGA